MGKQSLAELQTSTTIREGRWERQLYPGGRAIISNTMKILPPSLVALVFPFKVWHCHIKSGANLFLFSLWVSGFLLSGEVTGKTLFQSTTHAFLQLGKFSLMISCFLFLSAALVRWIRELLGEDSVSFNFPIIFFFWLIFWFSLPGLSLPGSLQGCVLNLVTFGGKRISMLLGAFRNCRMCIRIVHPRKGRAEYFTHQLSIFHWSRAAHRKLIGSHFLTVCMWVLGGVLPNIPHFRVREALRQKEVCGATQSHVHGGTCYSIAGLGGRLRECEVGGHANMLPGPLPGSSQAVPTRSQLKLS